MATITINRLTKDDIPAMHHEVRNSYGYLKELGWIEKSLYKEFKNHYEQLIDLPDLMIFIIRVDQELAGVIEVEVKHDSYFIGYWMGVRFRQKGIMSQCIADVIKHDLKNRRMLTARVPLNNIASSKVLTKLKFQEARRDKEWVYYSRLNI